MNRNDDIWTIIARYQDRSLNEEDSRKLENWLDESSENRRIFHSVDRIWKASEEKSHDSLISELNLEKDWIRVSGRLRRSPEERRSRILHFRKLRKRQQFYSNLLKVAALVLVAFMSGILTFRYAPQPVVEEIYQPVYSEIVTNAAERANVELSDGSKVTLNADSKLIIPDRFRSDRREVELQGQAFFDIRHDRNRPFYIQSGNAVVEVLGTSFDVRSYQNENEIRVAVRTGTIELHKTDDPDNKLVVNEGYKGMVSSENGKLSLELVDDPDAHFGWLQGMIVFRNTKLSDVFIQLERSYGVKITVEEGLDELLNEKFTASLKTRSVREVMDVIQKSMNIKYEVLEDGDEILIRM